MKNARTIILSFTCALAMVAGMQAKEKPTIAVLTLKNANDVSDGEAQIITDRLRIELFKTGNVEVMEREQMDVVLKEQGFQASGACSDEGCMVEMGQLLGVQFMIAGSIGKLGSMFLLNCRSVNISTAKIVKVVSVDIDGEIEDVVGKLGPIAWKLTSSETQAATPAPSAPPPSETSGSDNDEDDDEDQQWRAMVSRPIKCNNYPILEVPDFSQKVTFKLSDDNYEDICEALKEALDDAFRRDVHIATAARIGELTGACKSPVIRIRLEAYSTKPSGSQFIGTAQATVFIFDTPKSEKPVLAVKVTESGDRHWGEETPFENAFEEIASTLESQLGKADYVRKYRRGKR